MTVLNGPSASFGIFPTITWAPLDFALCSWVTTFLAPPGVKRGASFIPDSVVVPALSLDALSAMSLVSLSAIPACAMTLSVDMQTCRSDSKRMYLSVQDKRPTWPEWIRAPCTIAEEAVSRSASSRTLQQAHQSDH